MEHTKLMARLRKEISHLAHQLKHKLAATTSDINVLQSEMELIQAMESSKRQRDEDSAQAAALLLEAQTELEAAKKKFSLIKDEGFRYMASMDTARREHIPVTEETERLRKLEKRTDSKVQKLSCRLLKDKMKIESSLLATARAESIASDLKLPLQLLGTEIDRARDEAAAAREEAEHIKIETEKIELCKESTELRLQLALEELARRKSSEAVSLAMLRRACDLRMRERSCSRSTAITISRFEYEYLRNQVDLLRQVTDKKVAAAEAWVEASDAREKEISLKVEEVESKIIELDGIRDNEDSEDGEFRQMKKKRRSSFSSARRRSIGHNSSSFTVKKKKVFTKFAGFLKGKRIGEKERVRI